MPYIESNLLPNEMLVSKARIHWFIYVPGAVVMLIPLAGTNTTSGALCVFLGLVLLLSAWISAISSELGVTNRRVIAKHGLVMRKTVELNLSKIESLSVDQGIFGRIFDYGKVTVNGTGGVKAPFSFIAKPLDFRRTVNEQVEKLQEQKP